MSEVDWRVEAVALGQPRPQGSKDYLGPKKMRESSTGLPAWRSDVADAIRRALPEGWTPYQGPVLSLLEFVMRRPSSGRRADRDRADKRTGDAEKLERAIYDAATAAGLWDDDCRLVGGYKVKRVAREGEGPHCRMVFVPADVGLLDELR